MADFPSLHSALRSLLSDRHDMRHPLHSRDGDTDTQWNIPRNHRGDGVGFDRDARGPGGPEFGDGDGQVDGRWNQDDGDGPDPSRYGSDPGRGADTGDDAGPRYDPGRYGEGGQRPESPRHADAPRAPESPAAPQGPWNGADAGRSDPGLASRHPDVNGFQRPGEPAFARGDLNPATAAGSAVAALIRELRELPPELVLRLGQLVESNPAGLQRLPASPEVLAELVARSQQEIRESRQPGGAEGRLLTTAGDALQAADGRQEGRLPGDARFGAQPPPAAGEGRMAGDPGGSTALQAQQLAAMQARADIVRPADAALPQPRADALPAAAANPAAAGSTTVMDPAQVPPARTPGEAGALQARAEGSVVAGDRGGLSGLPGNAAAVAGGVTLAAVANPAGTTYAIAPQVPSRLRAATKAREEGDRDGKPDAGKDDRRRGDRTRGQDGPETPGKQAPAADARAAGHAGPGAAPGGHTSLAAAASWLAAMLGRSRAARTQQAPAAAAMVPDEQRRSRRLQWLYWSLIATAYGCLALSLATVAPDLFRLPIADEHLASWRNALTAAGLASGFWAWLLARRMR